MWHLLRHLAGGRRWLVRALGVLALAVAVTLPVAYVLAAPQRKPPPVRHVGCKTMADCPPMHFCEVKCVAGKDGKTTCTGKCKPTRVGSVRPDRRLADR